VMQFAVAFRIQPESWALEASFHEAFWLSPDRKASCCELDRNL
jgi:hypothetical protein